MNLKLMFEQTYLRPRPYQAASKTIPYLRFDYEDSSVYATPPEVKKKPISTILKIDPKYPTPSQTM
jgi:hypothetical protein